MHPPPDAIQRYEYLDRASHWLLAIFFFLAALSGLAFFHPSMFWLTHLFGGGTWSRILHPSSLCSAGNREAGRSIEGSRSSMVSLMTAPRQLPR